MWLEHMGWVFEPEDSNSNVSPVSPDDFPLREEYIHDILLTSSK